MSEEDTIHKRQHRNRLEGIQGSLTGDPKAMEAHRDKVEKWAKEGPPSYYDHDCKLCGRPIGIGWTNQGKKVALDLSAKIYAIVFEKSDSHSGNVVVQTGMAFVDHAETCGGPLK